MFVEVLVQEAVQLGRLFSHGVAETDEHFSGFAYSSTILRARLRLDAFGSQR